jgi:hypothetical protein
VQDLWLLFPLVVKNLEMQRNSARCHHLDKPIGSRL